MATCRAGKAYDDEHVTVMLSDILEINAYSNRRSIMRVGNEIRRYFKGTPMGEQSSCAKANGVALDAELSADEARERTHGDSQRNLSLAYVDDVHVRIAYSPTGQRGWDLQSARSYILQCYPAPLKMICEPEGLPSYRFLETTTHVRAESRTWCVHYNRPWDRFSFNMQGPGGPLFWRQQRNVEAGNWMRAVDNTTVDELPLVMFSLAARCIEMTQGAGFSRAFVHGVRRVFGRHPRYREFNDRFGELILALGGI